MSSPALPLSDVVDIVIQTAAQQQAAPLFNQGLIIGASTVISNTQRVRLYNGVAAMLTDGFASNSTEVLEAQLYFGQSPPPQFLWVGVQVASAIKTAVVHAANEGTGYTVGDILTVTQGGASGGQVLVVTVGGSGAVTSISVITANGGTGYTVASALPTTGGTGTGAEIDISAVGETPLTAVQNCRAASGAWWAVTVAGAAAADHEAIAAYVQAVVPPADYMFTTSDSNVPAGGAGNVLAVLSTARYTRTFGIYSTTQSGAFPLNIYSAAAAMGAAMGLNTGLPNSAFTMNFKELIGIAPEPLTQSQINTIEGNGGNVYVGYNNEYQFLEKGTTPTIGTWFDQILNRDMLAAAIQTNVMNLLVGSPKIPQNDPGEAQLIHAVNQACQDAVTRGYISAGTWEGVTILKLTAGQNLPAGYFAQAPPYSQQSPGDKAARKAQPIYLAIIEAGAVNSLLVGVYIQ